MLSCSVGSTVEQAIASCLATAAQQRKTHTCRIISGGSMLSCSVGSTVEQAIASCLATAAQQVNSLLDGTNIVH